MLSFMKICITSAEMNSLALSDPNALSSGYYLMRQSSVTQPQCHAASLVDHMFIIR